MTTGSFLLVTALFLVVGLYVARPFLQPRQRPPRMTERQALLAEKEALMARIRALDFDEQTGKQAGEIYQAERKAMLDRAADVLRRLEAVGGDDIEQEILAAVARLREERARAINFCPSCGERAHAGDKFCANCGEKLT